MKLNFKKISAIAASTLLAGMSLGLAAAAAYPAPFVSGGTANVAIVYGTGQGVSSLDQVQAGNIQTSLASSVKGGATTIVGEHVDLERPASLLHLGEGTDEVFGRSITKSDMPTLLADGTYRDGSNNEHDYTQKVQVANLSLEQFDLSAYDSNTGSTTPVIGVPIESGENILNYTLTFQDNVNASQMQYSTLSLMGTDYYVLSSSTSKITLLDSSSTSSLKAVGDTVTLNAGSETYVVALDYIDSNNVKFTVNGQATNTLVKGDTYKITNSDGSTAYIGVKDILSQGYSGGTSQVDFSIGSGKIELNNGSTVQVNSNSVDGVKAHLASPSTGNLNGISLEWDSSDSAAVTQNMTLAMPTFAGTVLSFGGMTYPSTETTKVSNDGNTAVKLATTVQNGAVSLDILELNKTTGNFTVIGKDSNHLLQTASGTALTFNANGVNSSAEFVVSWNNSKEAESYVYKVNNFVNDSGTIKADLVSQDGGSTTTMTNGTEVNIGVGNIVLTPTIDYSAKTVALSGNTGVTFDTLYTADGLKILLPTNLYNTTGGAATEYDVNSYPIQFFEEAKDGTIAGGTAFNVTVGAVGTSGSYQSSVTGVSASAGTGVEVGSSNVYEYNVASPLASTIMYDQGPTQESAEITYHGGESSGKLSIATSSAVSQSGALGDVLVKDSEVSSVSDKNLIIVGGSCINTAAATALGVSAGTCGDAFTAATGVSAGQFLIKGVQDKFSTGKLALVVAGYGADDTVNAATYLINKNVDTSKTYTGTSGTEATMSTA